MSFKMTGNMTAKLIGLDAHVKRGMVAAAYYVAPQAEAHMKANARWTDRTGAARNGLGARVVVEDTKVAIVLYHSVAYGVFLETRWGGKYAIIEPTMGVAAPLFAKAVGRLVFN